MDEQHQPQPTEPDPDVSGPAPDELQPALSESPAPAPQDSGQVDPDRALQGAISITFTFLPTQPEQPAAERLVVASIRRDQNLPAVIRTCRQADFDPAALIRELHQALADLSLKTALQGRPVERKILVAAPAAKPDPQPAPQTGQLGLF